MARKAKEGKLEKVICIRLAGEQLKLLEAALAKYNQDNKLNQDRDMYIASFIRLAILSYIKNNQ